ncbi:hypothetical protein FuraDRAFT_3091 [Pseudogulbenkiania ferrooxidans 2002]|uniref:Uncharacterized protein n=1 Tax=Pseudogulbenkiania ferrooxidans 2002 TaxID=279714 RepID=B9Z6V5_9NEIS|nr:hypothetical protein FuraDRAFT_3091 [Pseudogulbenkiania ferrooxidans 2002]
MDTHLEVVDFTPQLELDLGQPVQLDLFDLQQVPPLDALLGTAAEVGDFSLSL